MVQSPFAHLLHTNYIPSDSECARIRAFLTTSREDALRHKAEVVRLRGLLDEAALKHDAACAELAAHKALISPMRRMPDDVLRAVFLHTLPKTRNVVLGPKEGPLLLSLVCRRWRDVALSTPRLWASLHIVIPTTSATANALQSVVGAWLSRTGAVPLSMSTRVSRTRAQRHRWLPSSSDPGSDSFGTQLLAEVLLPVAPRWQEMELAISNRKDWDVLQTLKATDVPLLQYLNLQNEARYVISSGQVELPDQPPKLPLLEGVSLRSFGYRGPHGSLPTSIPYRTLHHLNLHISASDFPATMTFPPTFLQDCESLKTLTLSLQGYNISVPQDATVAYLPNLVRVMLDMHLANDPLNASPFAVIQAPALRSLDLSVPVFNMPLADLLRPVAHITRLRVRVDRAEADSVIAGLRLLNDLEELEMFGDPIQSSTSAPAAPANGFVGNVAMTFLPAAAGGAFLPPDFRPIMSDRTWLQPFITRTPEGGLALCPALRRLRLARVGAVSDALLLALLRARRAALTHFSCKLLRERDAEVDVLAELERDGEDGLRVADVVLQYHKPHGVAEYSPMEGTELEPTQFGTEFPPF
ncbi:F-box domain-containing protein [Mycena kentingensis (nom. inval.)]|nr:F-box domain-containing protein [Mycena kentingensis (nom. inval.)]